jgi:hypothetical protein
MDDLLEWVTGLFPTGSPCLFGGWTGYTLVNINGVTPGLAFNSQPPGYAKWLFQHFQEPKYHEHDSDIAKMIDTVLRDHPELQECIVRNPTTLQYMWFNAYSIPGWGEHFKAHEQVRFGASSVKIRPAYMPNIDYLPLHTDVLYVPFRRRQTVQCVGSPTSGRL